MLWAVWCVSGGVFCLSCGDVQRRCVLTAAVLQVIGKFSIRIVPHQTPQLVEDLVTAYLTKLWARRRTPNKLRLWCDGDRGWLGDTNHDNFQAGIRFTATVASYILMIDLLQQSDIPILASFPVCVCSKYFAFCPSIFVYYLHLSTLHKIFFASL